MDDVKENFWVEDESMGIAQRINNNKRKVALVSWDKICLPKKYDRLNIKSCRE